VASELPYEMKQQQITKVEEDLKIVKVEEDDCMMKKQR
jgi:hypothetical protein